MRKLKSISFSSDGYKLKGYLHLPEDNSAHPPVVVGSHGLFSTGNSPKQIALAQTCSSLGIAYFRFDHRGCGESEGIFSRVTSLESRSHDLHSAVSTIVTLTGSDEAIGLFGSSMGGATCLNVARDLQVSAIVAYASPIRLDTTISEDDLPVELKQTDPRPEPFKLQFDLSERIEGVGKILIVHGDADPVIPFSDAVEIHRRISSPKQLILLRDGDHPMSRKHHQIEFLQAATMWFKNRLLPHSSG